MHAATFKTLSSRGIYILFIYSETSISLLSFPDHAFIWQFLFNMLSLATFSWIEIVLDKKTDGYIEHFFHLCLLRLISFIYIRSFALFKHAIEKRERLCPQANQTMPSLAVL
jgi:predicted membrane channel-forming protein YqfA (hemolysin III family)